jgi:hypothetical protein|tara:strand:+ start:129 stop:443 length:315 start_codon:yes stop_codon:yes gene_type:complete
MKKHIEIYTSFWNPQLTIAQSYQCSWCNNWEGGEVHHILKRGQGGSKCLDYIENLVYLCRYHHEIADKVPAFNQRVRAVNLRQVADKVEDNASLMYDEKDFKYE